MGDFLGWKLAEACAFEFASSVLLGPNGVDRNRCWPVDDRQDPVVHTAGLVGTRMVEALMGSWVPFEMEPVPCNAT